MAKGTRKKVVRWSADEQERVAREAVKVMGDDLPVTDASRNTKSFTQVLERAQAATLKLDRRRNIAAMSPEYRIIMAGLVNSLHRGEPVSGQPTRTVSARSKAASVVTTRAPVMNGVLDKAIERAADKLADEILHDPSIASTLVDAIFGSLRKKFLRT